MALQLNGIIFDELTSDPGTPVEGQAWFNTTDHRFKIYRNGGTTTICDLAELTTHEGLANPHGTTLENARAAGATLSGDVAMGGNRITGLGGSASTDAATRGYVVDQVNSKLQGLDWQESVLDRYDPTGGTPVHSEGNRYISTATANGWTDKYIYESVSAAWVETIPDEGAATLVEDEDLLYIYDGSAWGQFGSAIDHGALLGKGDDDHTQYLLVSGTRAMSGGLDMGTFAISNVGNVDGVDVSAHNARHVSAGADEIDGDHLDIDFTPSNYTPTTAPAEASSLDHLTAHLAGIDSAIVSAGLTTKAGRVADTSFAGNPKTATVSFSTAFPNTNYSIQLTVEGSTSYAPRVDVASITTGGFDINMNANNIGGLDYVHWVAIADGET